ncbi:MAG: carbohydrate ABC transporter permease, partial [Thermotoga sp.]
MRKNNVFLQIVVHAILLIGAFTMLLPFIWMVSTSFKPSSEIYVFPPRWIPKNPTLKNYVDL